MKIFCKSLEERLHSERLEFFERVRWQREIQEMIDFVFENEWLSKQDQASVKVSVSSLFTKQVQVSIDNIPVEDAIENLLGPFHLKFNIMWKLELEGDTKDPVLEFKDTNKYFSSIIFRIKEGSFKSCSYERKVIDFYKQESRPVYGLEMKCF